MCGGGGEGRHDLIRRMLGWEGDAKLLEPSVVTEDKGSIKGRSVGGGVGEVGRACVIK